MDPLSIAASVAGILTAAGYVVGVLRQIRDAPAAIKDLLSEINDVRIVFSALQRFLDRSSTLSSDRAVLVQLDDVVLILTQTTLVFSDLEQLVQPMRYRGWRRAVWPRQRTGAERLVNRLQRQKSSLSLLLQIFQCDSNMRAVETAASLRADIEHQVDGDSDLAERLQRISISAEVTDSPRPFISRDDPQERLVSNQERSSLYSELNLASTVTRSIHLPLQDEEIQRFRAFESEQRATESPSTPRVFDFLDVHQDDLISTSDGLSLVESAIQLEHLNSDPSRQTWPTPPDGDGTIAIRWMVKQVTEFSKNPDDGISFGFVQDDNFFNLRAMIVGPDDTPYEGGIFYLAISVPVDYPFKPPKCHFQTPIYHPNIDGNGSISLDILRENWSAALRISKLLHSIRSFLDDPNPDDPLVPSVASLYKSDRELYKKTARAWTIRFATG